jgi:16S rRNA processing protein RimM
MESIKKKIKAGKIVSSHKLAGELNFQLEKNIQFNVRKISSLFIGKTEQDALPYFVVSLKPTVQNKYLLKLEDIATLEQASALKGLSVYVLTTQVQVETPELTDELIGYELQDEQGSKIGQVIAVLEYPGQWLLEFTTPEVSSVLLPVTPATVKLFDHTRKIILVDLPEGLIDIYK